MREELGVRVEGSGLVLLPKPVRRVASVEEVREATTGRVVSTVPAFAARPKPVLLPKVWAVAEAEEAVRAEVLTAGLGATKLLLVRAGGTTPHDGSDPAYEDEAFVNGAAAPEVSAPGPLTFPTHDDGTVMNGPPELLLGEREESLEATDDEEESPVELAFYRKYTEAMLRRYVRLSMAAGRVPSLLGRELFRGHVSSYKMTNFEDVVVFCFDMEKLLGRLGSTHQQLIKRIAMQQYTQGEVASMLRIPFRSCRRMYGRALDALTEMLLEVRMLEPLKSCQGGSSERNGVFD
jgi:hypothetical protein